MVVNKGITRTIALLIYSVVEILFASLLFVILNFGNISLHTEYDMLHDRPIYYFVMRSGLGIGLSMIFSLLQALFMIFGKRLLRIEKYSYRRVFILHLIVFSILTILFVAIRFYVVFSSDPAARIE
ncbi:hypothetical protein CLV42_11274 [Chitinophaga ginsengisoli]|uniref:Uncharacterized protein n=1 Tax=Chitinophaga ginsengisoli TaxID=363837 RepID=A0A2P8FVX5_9BACT|nr:hypothetical protein CLV42_11274 [Chitinophaga ginsengisoli]